MNRYIPCELFFAIANSIKYVMVVYVAKWIKKSTLIGMVGLMFAMLGALSICGYAFGYKGAAKDSDENSLHQKAYV